MYLVGGAIDPDHGLQRGNANKRGCELSKLGLACLLKSPNSLEFILCPPRKGRSTSSGSSSSGSDLEDELMVGFENGVALLK